MLFPAQKSIAHHRQIILPVPTIKLTRYLISAITQLVNTITAQLISPRTFTLVVYIKTAADRCISGVTIDVI
jgi:hypothetical protein